MTPTERAEVERLRQALARIAEGPTHAPGCQPMYCDCDASWEWPQEVLRAAQAALAEPIDAE